MAKEPKEPWMDAYTMESMYREAADKHEQLIILAELNDVPVAEICRILNVEFKPRLRVTVAMKRNGWTMADVKEAYRLRCFGWTAFAISEAIGHSEHAVRALLWAQIDRQVATYNGEAPPPQPRKGSYLYANPILVERVCSLHADGLDYSKIAEATGLSYNSVYNIVAKHVYGLRDKSPSGKKALNRKAAFGAGTP